MSCPEALVQRRKLLLRDDAPTLEAAAAALPIVLPGWLRDAVPDAQGVAARSLEDVALVAAAITTNQARPRRAADQGRR